MLVWGLGLIVLGWIRLASLPARDFAMTGLTTLCLLGAATLADVSLRVMWRRMCFCTLPKPKERHATCA